MKFMFIYITLAIILVVTLIIINDLQPSVNSGFATLQTNYSTVAVTHGLATVPYQVLLTLYSNPNMLVFYEWADNYTSTGFMINSNLPVPNAVSVAWRAYAKKTE